MHLPPSKTWFKKEGASTDALRVLATVVEVGLPHEYLDLLAFSNVGEGPLPAPFHTLCLDDAESAAEPGRVELFKSRDGLTGQQGQGHGVPPDLVVRSDDQGHRETATSADRRSECRSF
jgi:hypothetical protein